MIKIDVQTAGGSGEYCPVMPALSFNEIWCVDFEFRSDKGERPWPVCMVARELKSGRELRLWRDELLTLNRAPFDASSDALFVAYFASAELGCFLELGWPLPANVLDLFVEHRVETNGVKTLCGDGIVGALALRGLAQARSAFEKHQSNWHAVEFRATCCSITYRSNPSTSSPIKLLAHRG